ncbi:transposase [Candidatus Acetothermia bacterium]|nr:transposase [Candidatus Acetothermia bacterium]
MAQGLAATPGALERLVVGMYVRGLSTRDIEDLFSEVTGGQMISRSAVSELSQVWEEGFARWRTRSLAELDPLYFFLDAFYLPLRSGLAFLHEVTERGFKEPCLMISDGNPGLKKALRRIWPGV